MELKSHQQIAVNSVKDDFIKDNKTIVVHPTGMGKTYIALQLFDEEKDKKLMFVAPSTSILWQFKQTIAREYEIRPNEYKKVFPNLELITYQKMVADNKGNDNYIKDFDFDLVVFDEAHHLGAPNWGKVAQDLIINRKDIKFLGLTATPERTDGIDVVKEVFDGNIADEITLEEAVATRQLKMPNYITALYSYEPIIEELELGLESIQDKYPEKYLMLKKDMEKAKKIIEKSSGLPEIFAKHMVKKDGKYIVFCKDIEHLKKMVEAANTQGWFDGVNENVEILSIHSEEDEQTNKAILKRFRDNHTATKNTLRILFSVEKINEGLHLDDIAGEIMLRPTKSKIIFRQQLGRTMSITSNNERNVVFDIVDNIDSFEDIKDFMDGVRQLGGRDIEEDSFDDFYIADETREAREILRKIAGGLESEWEEFYQRSVKWRAEHDGKHPNGNSKDKEEYNTYRWERTQKLKYLKVYQDVNEKDIPSEYLERVNKLKRLGMIYKPYEFVTLSGKIDILVEYLSNSDNNPNISRNQLLEDGTTIGVYVSEIRMAYKNNKLTEEQIKKLTDKNFIWEVRDSSKNKTMQEKIDIVVEYLSNNDNSSNILKTQKLEDGTPIGQYVDQIRRAYKNNKLNSNQITKLESKNFMWISIQKLNETQISEKIEIVVKYLSDTNNDPHIKHKQKLGDGTTIGIYVAEIRLAYKNNKLTQDQIKKLTDKNFIWEVRDSSKNKTMQEKIDIVVEYLNSNKNIFNIKSGQKLEDGTTIGVYVDQIRQAYKNNQLNLDEISRLESGGFIWQVRDSSKNKTMQEKIDILVEYLSNNDNNSNILKTQKLKDGTPIVQYVDKIRLAYKNNKLTQDQIKKLTDKNFIWEIRDSSKNKTMQEKIDIVVEYLSNPDNSSNILQTKKLEDGTPIGQYVDQIRQAYKNNKLKLDQINQLNSKNFMWVSIQKLNETQISEKIDIVVEYLSNSDNNSNIKFSQILEDGTKIGVYVSEIRSAYRDNKLTQEQISKLESKNFIWQVRHSSKMKTMKEKIDIVVEYLSNPDNNSNIKINQILEDGTKIGIYVNQIRQAYKNNQLNLDEINQLEIVGFVWNGNKLKGLKEQKYQELSILEDLKQKAEQAENLEIESQVALENAINKNLRKPEGPGE